MTAEVITLTDPLDGATARVLPSLGFNCFSWQPRLDEGPREMLWSHPDFASGSERPSGSGIPLLFPFPGRIGGARFTFGGRQYALEPGDALGNAIHGFVFNRPWRIVERQQQRIVAEFQAAVDDPSILERWPSDFRIRVGYEVRGKELLSDIRYENTGSEPLPCGFGTHAYFRLPLIDGGDPESTSVIVPATDIWEAEGMLPTGRLAPADAELDVRSGRAIAGREFDTCYTNLHVDNSGVIGTELAAPNSERRLLQVFRPAFSQCVVYTPPHREAICLEPYTCVPDALRLADRELETGLQVLQPGGSFETMIALIVATQGDTESE